MLAFPSRLQRGKLCADAAAQQGVRPCGLTRYCDLRYVRRIATIAIASGRCTGTSRRQRRAALPHDSEVALRDNFGRKLQDLISLRDIEGKRRPDLFGSPADLNIYVRGINYGSIEILLAIVGGEDLITEMFWSALELYAPKAFNDAMGTSGVPMQAKVVHTAGREKSGKLERLYDFLRKSI